MSAPEQGRQSPPPEEQAGKQGTSPPSNAQGINQGGDNKKESQRSLNELDSNPKPPLDNLSHTSTEATKD